MSSLPTVRIATPPSAKQVSKRAAPPEPPAMGFAWDTSILLVVKFLTASANGPGASKRSRRRATAASKAAVESALGTSAF